MHVNYYIYFIPSNHILSPVSLEDQSRSLSMFSNGILKKERKESISVHL